MGRQCKRLSLTSNSIPTTRGYSNAGTFNRLCKHDGQKGREQRASFHPVAPDDRLGAKARGDLLAGFLRNRALTSARIRALFGSLNILFRVPITDFDWTAAG